MAVILILLVLGCLPLLLVSVLLPDVVRGTTHRAHRGAEEQARQANPRTLSTVEAAVWTVIIMSALLALFAALALTYRP
jgi:hypothetical protein